HSRIRSMVQPSVSEVALWAVDGIGMGPGGEVQRFGESDLGWVWSGLWNRELETATGDCAGAERGVGCEC
ncbi:MAG: hypothetical protein ACK5X8_17330, partial [Planctomyces sp.]